MIFVGIDPGYGGAVVSLTSDGRFFDCERDFDPSDKLSMFHKIVTVCTTANSARIAVERVNAQPKFGAKGAFQFGGAAAIAELAVLESGKPFEFVTPRTWQRVFWGWVADTKKEARRVCRQLWPKREWRHDGECDAALIAEWLRRRELGQAGQERIAIEGATT